MGEWTKILVSSSWLLFSPSGAWYEKFRTSGNIQKNVLRKNLKTKNLSMLHLVRWISIDMSMIYIYKIWSMFLFVTKFDFFFLYKTTRRHCGFFYLFICFRNTVADKIHVSAQNQVTCSYICQCIYFVSEILEVCLLLLYYIKIISVYRWIYM